MINLNKIKNINKNYLYLASAILMVIWISLLSSKTKITKNQNTETIPVINDNSKKQQITKVSEISPAANLTPYNLGEYSIKNNKLIFTLPEGNGYEIDTQNNPVTNFEINGSSIIITTGELYSTQSGYFLHNIEINKTTKINTKNLEPIVSISSTSDSKTVAIVGNLKKKEYKMSVYLYNPNTEQKTLINSNVSRNFSRFTNKNILLLGKTIDKNEPNLIFDIYDTTSNSYLAKDILSSQKATCSNTSDLFYLDYKTKSIKKINFVSKKTEDLKFNVDSKNVEIFCDETLLYIVSNNKNEIKTKKITLNDLKIEEKNKNLSKNQVYIQTYLQNKKISIKIYNSDNKSFSFIPEPE